MLASQVTLTRLVTALALMASASTAWALTESDKEAIRNLSDEAAGDYDARRFQLARDKFARAYETARIPSLALWTARANEKLGHWVIAYEQYLQATSLERNELWRGDAQQKAQKEASHEAQTLLPRIPRLTVRVEGADPKAVSVSIDGAAIPAGLIGVERLADPGDHQLVGQRGDEIQRERVSLREGTKAEVVLRFNPSAAAPGVLGTAARPDEARARHAANPAVTATAPFAAATPAVDSGLNSQSPAASRQRTWGWAGIGAGAVGVAVGSVAGVWVLSKYGSLKDKCNDNRHCDSTLQSEVSSYRTLRTVSTVGFVVGGVTAAAGITLLLTSPKPSESRVGLILGLDRALVTGTF